jgi:hypothetical protein
LKNYGTIFGFFIAAALVSFIAAQAPTLTPTSHPTYNQNGLAGLNAGDFRDITIASIVFSVFFFLACLSYQYYNCSREGSRGGLYCCQDTEYGRVDVNEPLH